VIVPIDKIDAMQSAAGDLSAREAKIIAVARRKGVTVEQIKVAMQG
jgi:hypothetical protein